MIHRVYRGRIALAALLLAAVPSCDRGFGIGLTIELSCPFSPASLLVTVTAHPGNQVQTHTIAEAAPFLLGSHRVVVVPPDGASDVAVQVDAFDGPARIGTATIDVAVGGHQLLERLLAIEPLGCACAADAGVCNACTSDINCPIGNPRCDFDRGECVVCLTTNDNCPAGTRCTQTNGLFHCATGCLNDADCRNVDGGALTSACCGQVCVDLATDNANCFACGTACTGDTGCCGGACIDQGSDPNNCGGCGVVCNLPNAVAVCASGVCAIDHCTGAFRDCDSAASDGCEAQTDVDPSNCGQCGMGCSPNHATPSCAAGVCNSPCDNGFADCDADRGRDGCEVDVGNDPSNCGMCGQACNASHVAPTCSGGMCGGTCLPGWGNCDGNLQSNGCETSTDSDILNCGACNARCVLQNATAVCVGGVCTEQGCTGTFADCDNNRMNGCETDLSSSDTNCGACGFSCGNDLCAQGKCSKRVFITSVAYPATFPNATGTTGIAAADIECTVAAVNAQPFALPGTYKAWISDDSTDASVRLKPGSLEPYARIDRVWVATSFGTFATGARLKPIDVTENGTKLVGSYSVPNCPMTAAWTGTGKDGLRIAGSNCMNWTKAATMIPTTVGDGDSIDPKLWTDACVDLDGCSPKAGIYCVQQ